MRLISVGSKGSIGTNHNGSNSRSVTWSGARALRFRLALLSVDSAERVWTLSIEIDLSECAHKAVTIQGV